MKFNSQPCTTKEQSKRLLALGLKKETADCRHWAYTKDGKGNPIPKRNQKWVTWIGTNESVQVCGFMDATFIPAWSLHRLIELLPQWIDTTETSLKLTIDQGKLVCYRGIFDEVQTFVFGHTSLYDSIIDIIEKLIKEGYFNKEYLE